jgi:hypothetical protein
MMTEWNNPPSPHSNQKRKTTQTKKVPLSKASSVVCNFIAPHHTKREKTLFKKIY